MYRSIQSIFNGMGLSKKFLGKGVLLVVFTLQNWIVKAQCAMCKAGAEQSLENGATVAKGLNTGIMYMLAFPLLAMAIVSFFVWKNWRLEK